MITIINMTKRQIINEIKGIIDRDLNFDFRPIIAYRRLMVLVENLEAEIQLEEN